MGGVDVEKTTAVGPQLFDGDLRGGWSQCYRLFMTKLVAGITEEEMRHVDAERKKKGLEPLFEDQT